jgi:hypothetical protein
MRIVLTVSLVCFEALPDKIGQSCKAPPQWTVRILDCIAAGVDSAPTEKAPLHSGEW